MFGSLLVANRGEIAVRVIRTARRLGIRTIAVYSDADAGALWTRLSDDAMRIGGPRLDDSYLHIEAILEAAKASGSEAVHPGYGMLSESVEFAAAVSAAGLTFVGPSAEILAIAGDKAAARDAAVRAGLPVLPGSGDLPDLTAARAEVARIGWPVLVKARFGGGGRGQRVAHDASELEDAFEAARREASALFARPEVYLEAYVPTARHVEVQVLADRHGGVIHLGDRDCSVQRRRQKLLEEAPAPNLDEDLRIEMVSGAVRLAQNLRFSGVGTVEFLVDAARRTFHFLEMNPRLQVEHGVTEMVTGVDLVAEQLRCAAGESLGFTQSQVRITGHAIQARINAELPNDDFRPCPGRIDQLELPGGPGVRCDFGVQRGDSAPAFYDAVIGKVLAWGEDREVARARLDQALHEFKVIGVPTTSVYLRQVLQQSSFLDATHDVGSVEEDWPPLGRASVVTPGDVAPFSLPLRFVSLPWGHGRTCVAIYTDRQMETAQKFTAERELTRSAVRRIADGSVSAPMNAILARVVLTNGGQVAKGNVVLILEAMKMEVAIRAPVTGVVKGLVVEAGMAVRAGEVLFAVEPSSQPV